MSDAVFEIVVNVAVVICGVIVGATEDDGQVEKKRVGLLKGVLTWR